MISFLNRNSLQQIFLALSLSGVLVEEESSDIFRWLFGKPKMSLAGEISYLLI